MILQILRPLSSSPFRTGKCQVLPNVRPNWPNWGWVTSPSHFPPADEVLCKYGFLSKKVTISKLATRKKYITSKHANTTCSWNTTDAVHHNHSTYLTPWPDSPHFVSLIHSPPVLYAASAVFNEMESAWPPMLWRSMTACSNTHVLRGHSEFKLHLLIVAQKCLLWVHSRVAQNVFGPIDSPAHQSILF